MIDIRNAFVFGCNLVGICKEGQNSGLICSWAMQINPDEILLAIGHQSHTGKLIRVGDYIGITVLNTSQKQLCLEFGMKSSRDLDKFTGIDYEVKFDTAILLKQGCKFIVGRVLAVVEIDTRQYADVFHCKIVEFHEPAHGEPLLLDHVMYG